MATISLIFTLLGLTTTMAGALTIFEILSPFITADLALSSVLSTALFWWAISVILILAGIAFGVYPTQYKSRSQK
jgi:hypothetical protein